MHTPTMFRAAQSPHASAGPSQGSPAAQRQLQIPPAEQSASTVQGSGADASVPEVVAPVSSVELDVSAPLDAGAHPSRTTARQHATFDTSSCTGRSYDERLLGDKSSAGRVPREADFRRWFAEVGSRSACVGTVDRFDPASETWTVVADGLVQRRFLSAVVHDGHVFVMGGYDEESNRVTTVERVDLETGDVTEVAPLPRPRYQADAVVRDGQIYFAGGVFQDERVDTVDRYDIAADVWHESPSVGAGRDMRLVEVGGEVYALGGYAGDDLPAVTLVERLDASTGQWVPVGDMPPTTAFSAASLGTFVITFGDYEDLDRVLLFDSQGERWSELHADFTPRRHSSAATIGDRVYVFGGNTASRDSWSNRLEVYELSCASDRHP